MDYKEKVIALLKSQELSKEQKEKLEEMFPELKESESEKIRKELIQYLKEYNNLPNGQYCRADFFTWLEKQGEQKPEGKTALEAAKEEKVDNQNCVKPADKAEPKFKAGDTITDPTDSTFTFHINAIKDGKYMESDKDWVLIKEADSDYELVEQKPAWSEEDENRFRNLIYIVEHSDEGKATKEGFIKFINRLKSLRPQNRWKPSDEQLEYLAAAVEESNENPVLDSLYQDLKKLRDE